jgi:hypothetical protein
MASYPLLPYIKKIPHPIPQIRWNNSNELTFEQWRRYLRFGLAYGAPFVPVRYNLYIACVAKELESAIGYVKLVSSKIGIGRISVWGKMSICNERRDIK